MTHAQNICQALIERDSAFADVIYDDIGIAHKVGDVLVSSLCREGVLSRDRDRIKVANRALAQDVIDGKPAPATLVHDPGFTDRSAAIRAGKAARKAQAPAGANGASHKLPEAKPEPARVAVVDPEPVAVQPAPPAPPAAEPAPRIESSPSSEQRVSEPASPAEPKPAEPAPVRRYVRAADLLLEWSNVLHDIADEDNTALEQAVEAEDLAVWLRTQREVHPAFSGLLCTLPPPGTRMPDKKLFALTTTITAMLEFFYGAVG